LLPRIYCDWACIIRRVAGRLTEKQSRQQQSLLTPTAHPEAWRCCCGCCGGYQTAFQLQLAHCLFQRARGWRRHLLLLLPLLLRQRPCALLPVPLRTAAERNVAVRQLLLLLLER
jgi:hypothetical protein